MDSTLAYAAAAAALSSYLLWFYLLARNLSGPTVWPVIGSLPGLFLNRSRIHDWISGHLRSSGPSATYQTSTLPLPFLPSGTGFYTVTAHPRNVEHILRTRFDNYPKGPVWQSAFHDLLGHGIFNADGPSWLVQRKTAALEFTTRTLRLAMARWVNRAIRSRLWVVLDKSARDHRPVDLQDLLLRLTFDNICGLTLGRDPETLSPDLPDNPFSSAFDSATSATLDRLLYPRLLRLGSERRLWTTLRVVDQYMSEALASRSPTTAYSNDDLISRFARRTGPDGKPYPDEVLKKIALNFVLAGRDTSSVALAWFFWSVMNDGRVEGRIIEELTGVLKETRGDDVARWREEPVSFEEAEKLVYMKAALAETLRLYPSVPMDFKYAVEDDVLPDGSRVPAGSTVTYSIYAAGRMKGVWGEDAEEFRPERWLSGDGRRFEGPGDGYRFLAFNGGPRTCLGKELAYLQMKSVAAAVMVRYRMAVAPGHRVEQKMSLTLFMKYGLKVYLEPRKL